jgi:aspartate kinase
MTQITVMKFGGTSVEDAFAIERVVSIVAEHRLLHPVVVVSAMSHVTDELVEMFEAATRNARSAALRMLDKSLSHYSRAAQTLLSSDAYACVQATIETARGEVTELLRRTALETETRALLKDAVLSYGEQLSAQLMAAVLRERGFRAKYVDARRCILTDDVHGCASPLMAETERNTRRELLPLIEASEIPVLGGFIAANANGATTTLGRNGSDYTAGIIGAALVASEIQLWTDVNGILTADPQLVRQARTIPRLAYTEASEMAYFGARVLYPKAVEAASVACIPMRICNTREPNEIGTLITAETLPSAHCIRAIVHKIGISVVHVRSTRVLGAHGFLRAVFEILDRHRTVVDVVTTSEVNVSLLLDDERLLPSMLEDLSQLGIVEIEKNCAAISIIGEGLRRRPGIMARVLNSITDINVSLISQSASNSSMSFVIEEEHLNDALVRLHEGFFEIEMEQPLSTLAEAWSPAG